MADETFEQRDVETLAAKLDTIDFTDDERAILQAVFRAASPPSEVEGFAFSQPLSGGLLGAFQPVSTMDEKKSGGGGGGKVKLDDFRLTR